MSKYPKQFANDDGWCDWVSPTPKRPYRMACCDCGLVHDLEFRAIEVEAKRGGWWAEIGPLAAVHRILFRARRNERETAKLRARDAEGTEAATTHR